MSEQPQDPFDKWFASLERRHRSNLTFSEIRRALTALSSLYVERRARLAEGAALEGEGKRAAFALFYGPLHFLTVRGIVRQLELASRPPRRILDLGCGSGAAGAAWALECGGSPQIVGVDRNGWAASEARWTYAELGLTGGARRGHVEELDLGRSGDAVLVAFTVNEMNPPDRDRLLNRIMHSAGRGAGILIVEPIAQRSFAWWSDWSDAFRSRGGRMDEWRIAAALPETLQLLSQASGMNHRELKAKSLWLPEEFPAPVSSR